LKVSDQKESKVVTACFEKEESMRKAINELNNTEFHDKRLLVSSQKEVKFNSNSNSQFLLKKDLNSLGGKTNLHVKNIPYDVSEEYLFEVFSKFGTVKSVKIAKETLDSKKDGEIVTSVVSKGFGYIFYEDDASAERAMLEMNNKNLPKYESWNRPLLINYLVNKRERHVDNRMQMQMQNPSFQQNNIPQNYNYAYPGNMMYNPYMNVMYNQRNFNGQVQPMMNNMMFVQPHYFPNPQFNNVNIPQKQIYREVRPNGQNIQNIQNIQNVQNGLKNQSQNLTNQVSVEKQEFAQLDLNYLESRENEDEKREYLGDIIYRNIENNEIVQQKCLSIDKIGKITGMIIGIEDLNEIIDLAKNQDQLHLRVIEAMELLNI
jgi:RNA recognition motif-containing protein